MREDIKTEFLFLILNMAILTIIEWNNLDSNIRNSESLAFFKKRILAFINPCANGTFHCDSPDSLKLITSLRLGLSHLRIHKFKHSFQDTCSPIWKCGTVEITIHYPLHCLNFSNEKLTLFRKLQKALMRIFQVRRTPKFQKCFSLGITHDVPLYQN